MSADIISDPLVMNAGPDGPVSTIVSGQAEENLAHRIWFNSWISLIFGSMNLIIRYGGKWICGLCAEAVKDEILRCHKLISLDEAMARHFSFCNKFRVSGPPKDPTPRLIRAMSQILRKSLDSPKSLSSAPSSPTRNMVELGGAVLTGSGSCLPSLTLVEATIYCGIDEDCD
ncbi:hypothetical protein F511_04604 [Dorcoceras hygrometricum]|uniref:Uncharacterized protein n=1 Tax=Dorcoceras hygrometricum TaxID=472368 RepID=A0A2Z7AZX4_9LAMI|nr:hypothetical protein F511_04604 [Dorcoceras hygrometricum]